ncbi:2-oxo acid dehydrogenase subunit E2 [Streptomyces niveus]|uniref:2-oxo acid dehydrogenase subunit E2 n=1 Tax=Streptomyces niveus TaxID=193462 RepID=UPI003677390A
MSGQRGTPMARQRRHTLYFLEQVRQFAPVHLDTEVDMTAVQRHREAATRRYSVVSYVLHTAARVLMNHPEANAAVNGRLRPRVVRFPTTAGKLTLDKTLAGHRVVLAAILPALERTPLAGIQDQVDHHVRADPDTDPAFAPPRALHAAPWPAALHRFRKVARNLAARPAVTGTFAVTSLGHRPVDGFHSVGGTTVTLGLGRTTERPVVRAGQVVVAPVMRLNLTFDHRVIDGAEAADVLAEVRHGLEHFPPDDAGEVEEEADVDVAADSAAGSRPQEVGR